jgi:N-acyl-D-aspartate/D-glutamate deacylase
VDGTGAPWYWADVGVQTGKIVEVGYNLPIAGADRVIDVKGLGVKI